MKIIKLNNKLEDINNICGGKGNSLCIMKKHNLPVPNGFIATTNIFGKPKEYWIKDVLEAFDELNSKYVAVRSSATKEDGNENSFAGLFDTYLFVTRENLIEKIIECHNSINGERIKNYCKAKKININEIKVAVVIQEMIASDSSGVCFSTNPINKNNNEIMIEAGYGLGEAIVSGIMTPDNYIVDKKGGKILSHNIKHQEKILEIDIENGGIKESHITEHKGKRQKLSDKNIIKLSSIAKKIEEIYQKPMDIERCLYKNNIYILQARPITTLGEDRNKVKNEDYNNYDINFSEYQLLRKCGFSPFFCSMYYYSGYHKYDFIFLHNGKYHYTYISERQKERLGEIFFSNYYENFNYYIAELNKEIEKLIDKAKHIKDDNLSELSNKELSIILQDRINLGIDIFTLYFPLEYHCTDKVSNIIESKTKGFDINILSENMKKLGEGPKMKAREHLFNACLYNPTIYDAILNEVKRRFSDLNEPTNYHRSDIISLLDGSTKNIQDLSYGFAWSIKFNEDLIEQNALEIFSRLYNLSEGTIELKGNIGNKGHYIGYAKVIPFDANINYQKEISLMKQGEVLVAGSTGPELMIACQKAGAIITDEGGIMSHAAIISRELGIPAVIATQYATDLIKDGDLIEVDANNGIIRKLS